MGSWSWDRWAGRVWRRVAGLSNPLVHGEAGKGGARSSLPRNCNCVNYPGWLRAGSHTEAGASPSPTCATIPSCPHHPSRASRQAWAMLCSKGGSQPASPSLSDIQGHIWGHPERAALDTTAFGRGAEGSSLVPWRLLGGQGGDPSDAQGCHQGPWLLSIIQDSAAELCRSRQAGVCGIWPRGARSARAQVTQWKAASRSVPCPYLQLFQL